jgi:antitoxin YefM
VAVETTYSALREKLASLTETAHLLRSPKNAQRLFESLHELEPGGGSVTLDELGRSVGLEKAS